MSDSFTDSNSPTSDDDPYSSSQPSTGYHIDRTGFSQPMPIIGQLTGFNDQFFAKVCRAKIEAASKILDRPLSSDEANAMAYWGAKQISILSYATPLGNLAGLWRCYDTRTKFRFPFHGPNMTTFNPFQFPNASGFGPVLINGPRAALTWHILRAIAYATVGKLAADTLFGSYAMSVCGVGEMKDPRLAEYREKITNDFRAKQANRSSSVPRKQIPVSSGKQGEDSQVNVSYDDASPSSEEYFDQTTAQSSATTNESFADKVKPSQVNRESEGGAFSMFDDASPTGGQDILPESKPSAPTGSAWERLRSGQRPAAPRPMEQNQESQQTSESAWAKQRRGANDRNVSDDEFSRSSSKETRRYGREEAQMEFDAKIERERKGGNFEGSEQKRW